ncbi:TetR/AcrR family transcriptional regulator [bacterium]|nr:TetR/AcrR family transcriptional regulator [bacterium]
MSPKVVDKSEKKNHILKAAIRVFAESGLANTKMAHVAQAAGIGKGTIYEYFKSKDELFWMAFEVFVEEMGVLIERKLIDVEDPVEQIRVYIMAWSEMLNSEFREFANLMIEIWAESMRKGQDKGLAAMTEMYYQYRLQIKSILDQGVLQKKFRPMNTLAVAAMIIGSMDGLFLQWLMDKDLFPIEEALKEFADIVITGLSE